MDTVNKTTRSRVMSMVKSKGTMLENALLLKLWKNGIRYRKHNPTLFGKPDISITGKKIVIFIDSCFWHGCREHLRIPKSNIEYWTNKIERNKKRDQAVNAYYREKKWRILRFWEHSIKKDFELVANEIINVFSSSTGR
jgi:DNA mismatch endonuclease (patch repair protein)